MEFQKFLFKSASDVAQSFISGLTGSLVTEMTKSIRDYFQKQENKNEEEILLSALSRKGVFAEVSVNEEKSSDNIKSHLEEISRWANLIDFKDSRQARKLNEIYITLNAYVMPTRLHISSNEKTQTKPLSQVISETDQNLVIMGLPGAGKTTSMKKVVQGFLSDTSEQTNLKFPILVRLREIDKDYSGTDYITNFLSRLFDYDLKLDLPEEINGKINIVDKLVTKARISAFIEFLNQVSPLLIFDGFDEIPTIKMKNSVQDEINEYAKRSTNFRMIVTSRTGEFKTPFEKFDEFEIAPLTWKQIVEFSGNWLDNSKSRDVFLKQIKHSPFLDTAMKPLSLAHLCAIYERTGSIPQQPKSVYKKIVRLLIEEWDEQRSITRESKYAKFDIDRKYEFLCNLAYYFSVELRSYVINHVAFNSAYDALKQRFKLKDSEKDTVINEIESHTGLLIQSGAETYEFAHKSLQEFLCAEHIARMVNPPTDSKHVSNISSELAVATSVSSNPSQFLIYLIKKSFLNGNLDTSFYYSFINRLLLERPDFEDEDAAFVAVLFLISLWFCKGNVLSHRKIKEFDARSGFNFGVVNFPTVNDLFPADNWVRLQEKYQKLVRPLRDTKRVGFSEEKNRILLNILDAEDTIMVLAIPNSKHHLFYSINDTLVLPGKELCEHLKLVNFFKYVNLASKI